ncbi:MAG: hypothetical protein JO314_02970 [Acidobacteria bacterium]|nr:hypothetical protein [Acidobacteriota bacterium]
MILLTRVSILVGITFLCGCSTGNTWSEQLRITSYSIEARLHRELAPWVVPAKIFRVEDHGARADGRTVNTAAIQATIDECSVSGGGVVEFSGGDYVTGTIVLQPKVMLDVAAGSRILGSTDLSDYPEHVESLRSLLSERYHITRSLIYAENVTDIGIRGKGEIYFRGEKQNFPGPESTGEMSGRPLGIRIISSSSVVMQDITLRNSAAWMQSYVASQDLTFDNIKVINHANFNNDGLDLISCRNVIIRNAFINAEDDAMCLKGLAGLPTENIVIEHSTFYSACNALKIGTETQGSFRNVFAHDVVLGGIPDTMETSRGHEAISGITLATVDGGDVEDVRISSVRIDRADSPIFIRLGDRSRVAEGTRPGHLHRVLIEDASGADNSSQGSFVSGLEEAPVEDVEIRNLELSVVGGGTEAMAQRQVSDDRAAYPDAKMFSASGLPGYGFFVDHARNVVFENVKVSPHSPDARPVIATGTDIANIVANGDRIK